MSRTSPKKIRQKAIALDKLFYRHSNRGPIIALSRVEPGECWDTDLEYYGVEFPSVIGEFFALLRDFGRDFGVHYAGEESELLERVLELKHGESFVTPMNEQIHDGATLGDWEIYRLSVCRDCGRLL